MFRLVHWLVPLFIVCLVFADARAQKPTVAPELKQRFTEYDRNSDGVLTRDEVDPAAPFDKLDANRDGKITLVEADTFLKSLHVQTPPSDLAKSVVELAKQFVNRAPNRNPIPHRLAGRSFPSVFMAWSRATNLPQEDPLVVMARHDLIFVGAASFGLRWNRNPSGLADDFQPSSVPRARALRAKLQELNPNLVLLAEIRYRDASPRFLPADHAWWKRNSDGTRSEGWEEGKFKLLDFSNPEYRAHVARRARAVMATGVFDGVMLDWWMDDDDRLELAKAVRHAIGEDAILLANANDRMTPMTAPYINGYFVECYRSASREDWERIAKTLRFAETQLRKPRLNCLETWFADSRQDLNRMRATTCLALTHSNGYCLFSDPNPLPTPDHLHDWYPFWEKRLGRPVGDGAINSDGSAKREFTHGTAVYNPPGNKPLQVTFEESRLSLATGTTSKEHVVPPLDGDIFLSGPMIRKGLVACRLRERGAHLVEEFSGDKVNRERWRIWHSNPNRVSFDIRDGRFMIRGNNQIGHNGLWQLDARRYKDVTLVANMDIRSNTPRTHDLCLHLCGGDMPLSPDHWAEIAMQDLGDDQVQFRPVVATELDGFDQSQKNVVLRRGDTEGFLGRVSLDGSSNLCSLEVRDADGRWHAIIDPTPLLLRTTHCEVKMRGEGTTAQDGDFSSVGWFDDVRIYPRAASHPVLVRLVDRRGKHIYQRLGETWPPTVHVEGFAPSPLGDLVVELWTADGKERVARSRANNFGYYMLRVNHDQWDVFPVAAKIRLSYQGKDLGEVDIPCEALDGLYPDDVYDLIVE